MLSSSPKFAGFKRVFEFAAGQGGCRTLAVSIAAVLARRGGNAAVNRQKLSIDTLYFNPSVEMARHLRAPALRPRRSDGPRPGSVPRHQSQHAGPGPGRARADAVGGRRDRDAAGRPLRSRVLVAGAARGGDGVGGLELPPLHPLGQRAVLRADRGAALFPAPADDAAIAIAEADCSPSPRCSTPPWPVAAGWSAMRPPVPTSACPPCCRSRRTRASRWRGSRSWAPGVRGWRNSRPGPIRSRAGLRRRPQGVAQASISPSSNGPIFCLSRRPSPETRIE